MDKQEIAQKITEIETAMMQPDFWSDKHKAQAMIKEMQELKDAQEGLGKYDRGNVVMSILAGAGGDDAEDFARILFEMYSKYVDDREWTLDVVHKNTNTHDGFRNITCEINGSGAYGMLKGESGVHRLVRLSPFNSKSQRHTSFALVEMLPKFEKTEDFDIDPSELDIEFTKASGPGGQNVNKRETAVRVVHTPTKLSAFVANERSQLQNKEQAIAIVKAKVYARQEEERKAKEQGMHLASPTEIEWGNQIRSYVMHPYQMVKDCRTGVEIRQINDVLDGDIQVFLDANKELE